MRRGLASFNELRTQSARACAKDATRGSSGEYPAEVQPLVSELNALLSDREQRVTRALTKAGDLAHGLKTPLTLLNQQAERAKAAGQTELAAAIMQQVERMRRQIDYHLAHARASASGGNPSARCHVLTSADGAGAHDDDDSRRSRTSRSTCRCRTSNSSAASARISTRCSATWSTTRASGRRRASRCDRSLDAGQRRDHRRR